MRRRVLTVIGAALGLLALGTVMVAQPGPPGPPPKPEPPPTITPQQIIDGVNQIIPHVSIIVPPPELLASRRLNGIPNIGAARSYDDGVIEFLAFRREGVRLYGARSLDDGTVLGREAGGTRLGAIELTKEYKLGSGPLKKGYYHIAALYDPKNEIDATLDPKNERDFHLVLVAENADADGQIDMADIHVFLGLPHRELARVMGMVDPVLQVEFAQVVLLHLIVALLQ
ncbi:MAG: hypothetical protein NZO41_01350 [Candidatus Bipolaricaulota bacterium]|nr:hypothetical protein [Candidatus Bipolaricaulota bacterium]MDW8141403.1 hypothetical protein [Candidatus Bipolaricaulota bacterium]